MPKTIYVVSYIVIKGAPNLQQKIIFAAATKVDESTPCFLILLFFQINVNFST